ncbi:hypothetical protein BD770DRAFT_411703 [Pilaira anomala]|nr:hypothetical protein BD770DRAFT_411703 [Pilaira anomala]
MTNKTTDGTKLIIGTTEFNYLINTSIRVDSLHLLEVGTSTKSFLLNPAESSKNTQKFLSEDIGCSRIEISLSLYQVRQIRSKSISDGLPNLYSNFIIRWRCSKFTEIETYDKLQLLFDDLNMAQDQAVTILTWCYFSKPILSDNGEPYHNYTLRFASFLRITTEVFNKKCRAHLEKDIVESIMLKIKDQSQKIPKIIKEILRVSYETITLWKSQLFLQYMDNGFCAIDTS